MENASHGSPVATVPLVAPTWLSFSCSLDWPAARQFTSVTGGLRSALGRHSALQVAALRGSLHQLTSGQCSDVVGEGWNPQILVNLPVTNVTRCVSHNAKALGL
jgi:hypothetical protein